MMDKNYKLSDHFTLGELTKTSYKTPDGNEPPLEAVENLAGICNFWLEELRRTYNKLYVKGPKEEGIIINHGFRSVQVSEKMAKAGLKPSKTSNHLRGCAVDIGCAGIEQALRYMTILLDMSDQNKRDFDELIMERRGIRYWIHFAVRPENNRRKILFLLE
jgi:hypothetical protein